MRLPAWVTVGLRGASRPLADHISDDNGDDSCAQDYAHNSVLWLTRGLFARAAWSWQCGGQGFESP
jgi:hypothetical protein